MSGRISDIIRGPLLIPRESGHVDFFADGVLVGDNSGTLLYAGSWSGLKCQLGDDFPPVRTAAGVMLPPLVDLHIHIPQHPIRGRFTEGLPNQALEGKLLEGLRRNVFPAEANCSDREFAERVSKQFLADTLRHGVVGGAAYMTPSGVATEAALRTLPELWSVGLVLMDQNCPPNLRTDAATATADIERLAERFGRRLIVTDRFAVAVSSPLRRRGAELAGRLGLRTQTHLNEQVAEKDLVESKLYPNARSYTHVYLRDGLLGHQCLLAHCIQMRPEEWQIVADTGSSVAHCPSSNALLGSGVMPLDEVIGRRIPYAIATDVGASPTVSLLAEMGRFLNVHAGRSRHATPAEALFRTTLAPAMILGIDHSVGRLEPGRPMSFIEVAASDLPARNLTADHAIRAILPTNLNDPTPSVRRVTLAGRCYGSEG